jgi:hypothetical protein
VRLAALWLVVTGGVAVARCAWADGPPPARLGRLEQESVDEALADNGLAIEPHPEGKIIRAIYVVNQEVFSRRDWWLGWFNIFHRTTRPSIIERELLPKPGQVYDQALVEETLRNLQAGSTIVVGGQTFPAPELSSVIVILPIRAPPAPPGAVSSEGPGTVDLLAVTRDVWSLRFNTNFEFQQNTLSLLATSLSENNLFGWRKYLSYGFSLNLGSIWTGPTYFDPNIAGTRLTLYAAAAAYYSRQTRDYEGNTESFARRYPLFSLASRWGAGIDVVHTDTLLRRFRGTSPRLVNLPDLGPDAFSATAEPVPFTYRARTAAVDANVTRQFGHAVIHAITLGYRVNRRRYEVPGDFPDPDPNKAALFLATYAPVPETRSEAYIRYDASTPRYAVFRDLNTFDLRENLQLGPILSATIGYGAPELGADFRAVPMGLSVGWVLAPRGGLASLTLGTSARLRDGTFIDQRYQAKLTIASPLLGRWVRVVASGLADTYRNDTQRNLFSLGGDTRLRGYAIGDFLGTSELVGNVELRTAPVAVFSQRVGSLLFYDVGDAAPSFSRMFAQHDFGAGVRWLIPQLNSSVLRLDWAIATQNTAFTRAGLPGRVSAGYQQVF